MHKKCNLLIVSICCSLYACISHDALSSDSSADEAPLLSDNQCQRYRFEADINERATDADFCSAQAYTCSSFMKSSQSADRCGIQYNECLTATVADSARPYFLYPQALYYIDGGKFVATSSDATIYYAKHGMDLGDGYAISMASGNGVNFATKIVVDVNGNRYAHAWLPSIENNRRYELTSLLEFQQGDIAALGVTPRLAENRTDNLLTTVKEAGNPHQLGDALWQLRGNIAVKRFYQGDKLRIVHSPQLVRFASLKSGRSSSDVFHITTVNIDDTSRNSFGPSNGTFYPPPTMPIAWQPLPPKDILQTPVISGSSDRWSGLVELPVPGNQPIQENHALSYDSRLCRIKDTNTIIAEIYACGELLRPEHMVTPLVRDLALNIDQLAGQNTTRVCPEGYQAFNRHNIH